MIEIVSLHQCVITFGLLLDVVGVILLYMYGLPSRYPEHGMNVLCGSDEDKTKVSRTQARFKFGSRLGILLLCTGFVLQIAGTWMS